MPISRALRRDRSWNQLQHYKKTLITKHTGSLRLIEAPKLRLKQIQRKVLGHILAAIPAHPAVHGFVRGRSALTFTAAHEQKHTVLRMDVKDFFPSIRAARIAALFRTFGYPESVSETLTGLCTTMTPNLAPKGGTWEARKLYARRHLPQGAPTSPMLANLCMYRADCRLSALARAANATYTRYADDLAFSGGAALGRRARCFSHHVAAILLEEGFAVQHRKTRIMSQAIRQHLAGLVVNVRPNVPRDTYDLLKAILTNCIRLGPNSQNRELHPDFRAHLEGRVSYVSMVHPVRGERLRRLYDKIVWPE